MPWPAPLRTLTRTHKRTLYPRVLLYVWALECEASHRLRPHTRPFGPNSFRRSRAGHLANSALVGLAVGRWSQGLNLPQERFFEDELERRGFEQTLAIWRGDDAAEDAETVLVGIGRFDQHTDRASALTVDGLAGVVSTLDQVFLGGDRLESGALSPAEVIEDMPVGWYASGSCRCILRERCRGLGGLNPRRTCLSGRYY